MLPRPQLLAILPMLPTHPIEELCFRAVHLEALYGFHRAPPYTSIRPLFPLGAPASGARFTPVGGMNSLYVAADPETAFAEANQIYTASRRHQSSLLLQPPGPTVLFSVRVRIEKCLDLTDVLVMGTLNTSAAELTRGWRRRNTGTLPATQELGLAAFDSGQIQAMRYPSVRQPGHTCFVIFTDRLAGTPAFAEVYDPDDNLRERIP